MGSCMLFQRFLCEFTYSRIPHFLPSQYREHRIKSRMNGHMHGTYLGKGHLDGNRQLYNC